MAMTVMFHVPIISILSTNSRYRRLGECPVPETRKILQIRDVCLADKIWKRAECLRWQT